MNLGATIQQLLLSQRVTRASATIRELLQSWALSWVTG